MRPKHLTILTVLISGLTCPALAADTGMREAGIAATHAGDAAMSPTVDMARMHFHHVINCLVGPKGGGYDLRTANPCQGIGNGAIADTPEGKKRNMLIDAVAKAQEGLATDSIAVAQKHGEELHDMLHEAMAIRP